MPVSNNIVNIEQFHIVFPEEHAEREALRTIIDNLRNPGWAIGEYSSEEERKELTWFVKRFFQVNAKIKNMEDNISANYKMTNGK